MRVNIIPYKTGYFDEIFIARFGDLHHGHGLAVKASPLIRILKTIHDVSHLPETDNSAVLSRDQGDIFKFASNVTLALGTDQHVSCGSLDDASRQIKTGRAHSPCHLIKSKPVTSQVLFRDLNRYLILPDAEYARL